MVVIRLCIIINFSFDLPKKAAVVVPVRNDIIYQFSSEKENETNHYLTENVKDKQNHIDLILQSKQPVNKIIKEDNKNYKFNVSTLDILAFVWMSVAIGRFIYSSYQYLAIRKNILSQLQNDDKLDEKLNEIKKKLNIKNKVKIAKGDYIGTPMLVGIISPIIIIPNDEYKDIQLEMILYHELYHLKRKDVWFKFLINFVICFYWFNPLFVYMAKCIDEDIELACDCDTVKDGDKEFKVEYAQTIMRVIAMKKNKLIFSTSFSQTAEIVKERFKTILSFEKLKKGKMVISLFAIIVMFSTSLVACGVKENYDNIQNTYESRLVYTNIMTTETMQSCEDEWYFMYPTDNGGYAAKINLNNELEFICNKDECTHDNELCNAYLGDKDISFFTIDEKPYAFVFEDNKTNIVNVSPDGFSKVLTLDYRNIMSAVVNENMLYVTVSTLGQPSKLLEIDIQKNQIREVCVFEISIKSVQAKSVINNNVVVAAETSTGEYVCTVDLETGNYVKIKEFKNEDIKQFSFESANKEYMVNGDKIYVMDLIENNITMETIGKNDINVLVKDMTSAFDVDSADVYQKHFYLISDNIVMIRLLASTDENLYGEYIFAVNIATKEVKKISVNEVVNENFFEIIAQLKDKFCVVTDIEDNRQNLSVISKKDYFENKANLSPICIFE